MSKVNEDFAHLQLLAFAVIVMIVVAAGWINRRPLESKMSSDCLITVTGYGQEYNDRGEIGGYIGGTLPVKVELTHPLAQGEEIQVANFRKDVAIGDKEGTISFLAEGEARICFVVVSDQNGDGEVMEDEVVERIIGGRKWIGQDCITAISSKNPDDEVGAVAPTDAGPTGVPLFTSNLFYV